MSTTVQPRAVADDGTVGPGGQAAEEASRPHPRARLRRRRPHGIWRVLTYTGYTLIALGLVTFLFVAYTLWGTRLQTARAQAQLADEFEEQVATAPAPDTAKLLAALHAEWDRVLPGNGPIARLQIPKLGVDSIVVAGTSRDALRKGPGALEGTSLPGTPGNAVISGHRTTYGAEFNRIDELVPGDEFVVMTLAGKTVYRMTANEIVAPDEIRVTYQRGANELTLTTCNPKFSAAERLIVYAEMVSGPFAHEPAPPAQEVSAASTVGGGP